MNRAQDGIGPSRVTNLRAVEMADYLDGRLHTAHYDEATFARSLLLVAELHGMSHVARECGLGAETVRRQLNGMRPLHLDTVTGVMRALGLRIRVKVDA